MAQVSICRALAVALFFAALLSVTAVTAQQLDLAPSPSMDAGAAFPVTVSSGVVFTSLLFSVIALLMQ
ncbi:No apical meristem (NAM) protein [Melia azedarach]|uniref:No apical meristem (NAM) protein n=1 Tax=Melia azedarach TaxID=155640 RepID=A0ACC1YM51_MELAZ|nr:No apical meristem (NAM) protein [Melia azedarach]